MKNLKLEENLQKLREDKSKTNAGELAVLMAYNYTKQYTDSDEIVFRRIIWEKEFDEFIQALNDYRIEEFIINERSTGLMELLQYLLTNGYKVEGVKSYINLDSFEGEKLTGLLIKAQ